MDKVQQETFGRSLCGKKEILLGYVISKIKITDYVPSSKPSWGWASAGWWIIPSYDSAVVSENIFDKAKAAAAWSSSFECKIC